MRDPRLVEIEFLKDLDLANEERPVRCTGVESSSYLRIGDREMRYGLDGRQFRDLVVDALLSRSVVPPATGRSDDLEATIGQLEADRSNALKVLTRGEQIAIAITHAGRVRLWELRDELLRDADIGPMGLLTKAALLRALPVMLQWASSDEPLTVMFIDLDHFKRVNDELGHPVGDKVLLAAFSLIKNHVSARGRVYQYGGEEVCVLVPKTSLDAGRTLAEELRVVLERGVQQQVPELGRAQTASIGVAAFATRVDAENALKQADALMYQAKQLGRNRVVS